MPNITQKKVLLTGATGFLGSYLAHQLVKQSYQVIILKKCSSSLERIQSILPDISTYNIDVCNITQPFKDHGKIDIIIHTATCHGRNRESSSEIFETNLMFPMRLLETATFFNTDIFFNTDTISYKYLNNYSLSKKQFVEWGKGFTQHENIAFTNIQLEYIYGIKEHDSKFATYIIKSCLANIPELKLTLGEQKRDFIYIDDVVSAYMILLQKAQLQTDNFQEYNLGSGKTITIREFVENIHKITQSCTKLNFGALPYRENEIMQSKTDTTLLNSLGWQCKTELADGIKMVIEELV